MLAAKTRMAIVDGQVVHETVDGETVIVHLPSGRYHSLSGWGPVVWSLVVDGMPLSSVVDTVEAHAGADRHRCRGDVERFVEELVNNSLLVPATEPAALVDPTTALALAATPTYEPPECTSYDDMMSLLMLDPVHDVDASVGWPAPAATVERQEDRQRA